MLNRKHKGWGAKRQLGSLALTLAVVATGGCTLGKSHNAGSLKRTQVIDPEWRYERLKACEHAFSVYGRKCRTDLIVHRGYRQAEFCRVFAQKPWPESRLPHCRPYK